ncbi:O-antigen ligase family protein [Microbacterium caowuchunii]|uniref:O-antigen ligase family protein n=1 Tax=Microbacterium caowuchunii TaxID=2614638 RepID=UPI00177E2EC4|nr:O-antigen ligase family protein [Microbacterium caowuchunii]
MILAIWAHFWVPSLINAVLIGRQYAGLGDVVVSPLAGLAAKALQYLSIGLILVAALDAAVARAKVDLGRILLAIVPWASIYVVDVFTNGGVPWQAWMYPPAMAILSIANLPAERVYTLIRNMTLFIAGLSLMLALLPGQPGMMPMSFHSGGEKAIIGSSILAGPYGHSNQLGLNMALGLPFVAWTTRGFGRVGAIGLVGLVLLWSASRTSILVAVAVLIITLVTLWAHRAASRVLVLWAAVAAFVAMVALPLINDDPTAFTQRGMIWQQGLISFMESPLTGTAANAFMEASDLSLRIGDIINTGHNVFVTVATIGGLIGIVGFVVALLTMLTSGARRYAYDAVPLLVLMTILLLSVIEDPLRALILAPASAIIWPIISILFRRPDPVGQFSPDALSRRATLTKTEKVGFTLICLVAGVALAAMAMQG